MPSHISDQALVQLAKVGPGLTVLAKSEGMSDIALSLANTIDPGGHLTFIVPDPMALSTIAEKVRLLGLANLTLRFVQGIDLPFPDGAFDRVLYEIRPDATRNFDHEIGETYRVLKPGGLALLVSLSPTNNERPLPENPEALISAMTRTGYTEIQEVTRGLMTGTRSCRLIGNADVFGTRPGASA